MFFQPQRFIHGAKGVQLGLGAAAPPGFVLKAQRPGGMRLGQADQAIALMFFWA